MIAVAGWLLLAAVLAALVSATALVTGWRVAATCWTAALGMTALIVAAGWMIEHG